MEAVRIDASNISTAIFAPYLDLTDAADLANPGHIEWPENSVMKAMLGSSPDETKI